MQAALQPYVYSAISKTINVSPDYPFETFARLYELAYEKGRKGAHDVPPQPSDRAGDRAAGVGVCRSPLLHHRVRRRLRAVPREGIGRPERESQDQADDEELQGCQRDEDGGAQESRGLLPSCVRFRAAP